MAAAAAAQEIVKTIEILASPLPAVPDGEALTVDQWKVLFAIGDAVIGDMQLGKADAENVNIKTEQYNTLRQQLQNNLPKGQDANVVDAYLSETASTTPGLKDALHRLILECLRQDSRDGIRMILSTLKYVSRPGGGRRAKSICSRSILT